MESLHNDALHPSAPPTGGHPPARENACRERWATIRLTCRRDEPQWESSRHSKIKCSTPMKKWARKSGTRPPLVGGVKRAGMPAGGLEAPRLAYTFFSEKRAENAASLTSRSASAGLSAPQVRHVCRRFWLLCCCCFFLQPAAIEPHRPRGELLHGVRRRRGDRRARVFSLFCYFFWSSVWNRVMRPTPSPPINRVKRKEATHLQRW